jgi:hypothetical protein
MTSEDLVTIAKYGDSQEASLARAMLEDHGITGLVVGGELNSTLWHLGPTISGVELQVPSFEATRASEILESFLDTRNAPTRGDWTCPRCGEKVDAGFDVCWSCGAAVDEPRHEPADSISPTPERAQLPTDEQVPGSHDEEGGPDPSPTPDDQARRALKAAAYGMLFAPLVFYALFLLLELSATELSKPALKQYYQAAFIVLLMLSFWSFVLWEFR